MIQTILKLARAKILLSTESKKLTGSARIEFCYCTALGYTVDCSKYDQICPLEY